MQPPPRGCVLKQKTIFIFHPNGRQPPPRGCVLKHGAFGRERHCITAAASARLCVETKTKLH